VDIKPVSEILNAAGFNPPSFNALMPDVNNYRVVLFQPQGNIEASTGGVRNRDRPLARTQFLAFLREALERNADLAVTPEYSLPWEVLIESLKVGLAPAAGKLWALGCESIRYAELQALKADLAGVAEVLFEPLKPDAVRFVDPLAYVFRAPAVAGGAEKLVVLVQFKTTAMGDNEHFEVNNLQRGTHIYQLGSGGSVRLVSLICSDVFGFTDADALAIYARTLVLHIQLNPQPRNPQYRIYRDKLLGYQGDATELVCLNWAGGVSEWTGGKEKKWGNVAASAWYLRPDRFDSADATLGANHKRGLYYTWLKTLRFHALFFNYRPGIFVLDASKVVHIGVHGPLARRRGPQLLAALVWDKAADKWTQQNEADDGFLGVTNESGDARQQVEALSTSNPLYVERLLALSAGQIGATDDWFCLQNVDSCAIDASEVIRRMTFCQDTDTDAAKFRIGRLKLCGRLTSILKAAGNLPPAIKDFAGGFVLDWSPAAPHHNARTDQGGPATVVYMGEQARRAEVEALSKRLAEFLHRKSAPDESLAARQRLAVWFQDAGQIQLFDSHRYVQIDQSAKGSEFDIGRES
jgi:hypothetical protein